MELPEDGQIAVVGAVRGDDLSALPKDRVQVVQRHFPDHQAFLGQGYDVVTEVSGPYALSLVSLPRAKAEARSVISAAAKSTNGPVVVDGQKTDGIDSCLKDLRKRAEIGEVISKAHGKLFVAQAADLSD